MKVLTPLHLKPLNTALIVFSFLLSGLFTSSCRQNNKQADKENTAQSANLPVNTVVIPIEGMSCGACAANVKRSIHSLPGIKDVAVSLEKREAKVSFVNKRTSPEQMREAINALGYKAGKPTEAKKE